MSWSIRAAGKAKAVEKFVEQIGYPHNTVEAKEVINSLKEAVESFPELEGKTLIIECDGHIDQYSSYAKLEIKTY